MHTQLVEASVHEKIKEFYKFFPESLEDVEQCSWGQVTTWGLIGVGQS